MHKRRFILVAGVATCLAGCGGAVTSKPTAAAATPSTSLTVRVWPDASMPQLFTFRQMVCGGPAGAGQTPARICAALQGLSLPALVHATPMGVMCTMLYGGPGLVRIDGVLNHAPVHAEYRRTDGCELVRWQRLVALGLVAAGVGSQPTPSIVQP